MPHVLPILSQIPHSHILDRLPRNRGVIRDEAHAGSLDNDTEDRRQAVFVARHTQAQVIDGVPVQAPRFAVATAHVVQAVCAAVDDALHGFAGVGDGDGEDGDVGSILEVAVAHGPDEVVVEVAADDFFGGDAFDGGVAGAHADVNEVGKGFLGLENGLVRVG